MTYYFVNRFVAMHYAATVFPPDDAPSRYLLLLACGDNKHEISTEAMKALYGVVHKNEDNQQVSNKISLPEFVKLVSYIYSKMQSRRMPAASGRNTDKQVLPYSTTTFSEVSSRWRPNLRMLRKYFYNRNLYCYRLFLTFAFVSPEVQIFPHKMSCYSILVNILL